MREGEKHVQQIPADWVDSVRQRVDTGRDFRQAVAEIFGINAQLLALERERSRESKRQNNPPRRPR
jgi:hypothetical protein